MNMKKTKLSVVHDDDLPKETIIKKETSYFRWKSNSSFKREKNLNFSKKMSFVIIIIRKVILKQKTNGPKKQFLSLK
jgi:hypothetical protein